mgnify:CR=1 FL=1
MSKAIHPSRRDPYWDCLKFILIFMVVFGHTLKGKIASGSFGMGVYNFIYIFHMPLFIFISGRFSQKRKNKRFFFNILRLLETYIVFQIILTLLKAFVNHKSIVLTNFFFTPEWAMWYLPALVFWRLLLHIIPDNILELHAKQLTIISFIIGIGGGFIPFDTYFTSHHTLASLPFFMMGYYSYRVNIREKLSHVPSWTAWCSLTILLLLCVLWFNGKFYYILTCGYSYFHHPIYGVAGNMIGRIIVYALAIFISLMLMRIVPASTKMAKWGSVTMIIYVFHPPLLIIINCLLKVFSISCSLPLSFIISIVITIFLVCISRYKFINIMVNPVTYWKSRIL